jgi:hypothetical protein
VSAPHRTGASGTGTHRTGTYRTGVVRGGAGRTAARSVPQRTVGHRNAPTRGATARSATARSATARSATARSATARSATARSAPQRSVSVRPDLRLVPPPTPARATRTTSRSRRIPFVLLILALLVGTTLSLLVLNTAIAVDSLKATSLRQENARRDQEIQRLEQQVVDGSTAAKLAAEAAAGGLVPAGTAGYLVVHPDGTSTLRGVPTPAPAPPQSGAAGPSPAGGN